MNVVCCWPSQALTPTEPQIQACRSNLSAQLAVVDTKYVLVCGRIAAQALLPHTTIKHSTGKLVSAHGKLLYIVRHPASFIGGRAKKEEYYEWLEQLKDFKIKLTMDGLGEWVNTSCLYCEKDPYPSPYSLTCRGHGYLLQADSQWEQGKRWWKTNSKNTRKSKETEERML